MKISLEQALKDSGFIRDYTQESYGIMVFIKGKYIIEFNCMTNTIEIKKNKL